MKKGSKRLRGEKKRAAKLRQHSGRLSPPLVSSIPQRIIPFTSDSPLDIIYDSHIRRLSYRRSSFAASCRPRSRKRCIRARAKRMYLRYLARPLVPKPHCEIQQQQPTIQLPANVMPNDLDPRGTGNKTVYRHLNLVDIIDKVELEEKDRDRLHGLVTCAEEFKLSQNKNCKCNNITSLGWSRISFTLSPSHPTVIVSILPCLVRLLFHLHLKYFVGTFVSGTRFRGGGKYLNCDNYIYHCVFLLTSPELPLIKLKNSHFISYLDS